MKAKVIKQHFKYIREQNVPTIASTMQKNTSAHNGIPHCGNRCQENGFTLMQFTQAEGFQNVFSKHGLTLMGKRLG